MPGPGSRSVGKGAFGALGAVRSFFSVVKEIDFDDVRDRAELRPRFVIVGPQEEDARAAATRIFGTSDDSGIELHAANRRLDFDKNRFDGVIVTDPQNTGLIDEVRRFVGSSGTGAVFELRGNEAASHRVEQLRLEITTSLTELAPALGRHYDVFRPAAVKAIVDETAKANAQFALVSNVPAVIPILGSFVAASADVIVLTKNQIMMCYKIAATHDRDLHDQVGVIRELVPVVGAGFLWRTLAREAASFIPFAAGTIPKVVVAYAGTFSAGHAADFYYRFGKKPSADQIKALTRQATEVAKQLPFLKKEERAKLNGSSADDPTVPLPPGDNMKG